MQVGFYPVIGESPKHIPPPKFPACATISAEELSPCKLFTLTWRSFGSNRFGAILRPEFDRKF